MTGGTTTDDILEALNDRQREAATHGRGPLLILAGAGTGKTRVIVHRIAWLIEAGLAWPDQILALTFTNKAAREMKERCESLVGPPAASVHLRTFHSFGAWLLRRHGDRLGPRDGRFSIFDETDRERLIKRCMGELRIDESIWPVKRFADSISTAKNKLETAGEQAAWDPRFQECLARAAELYERKLRECNAFDFDDLIVQPIRLLEEFSDLREGERGRRPFILVDEYQDTNRAQFEFLRLLVGAERSVTVVGDDDQSIYGWRGADVSNILNFESAFPGCEVVKLERNYRSVQPILTAANGVISHNRSHRGKRLWTDREEGSLPVFYEALDERDEMRFVLEETRSLMREGGLRCKDFAVLFRTRAQSRVIEEELINSGVPHRIVGGVGFFQRKEIKDLVAYLKFLGNPRDQASFARIANEPKRGIGPKKLQKLLDLMTRDGEGFLECGGPETEGTYPREATPLLRAIKRIRDEMDSVSVPELIERVLDLTQYRRALESAGDMESESRLENLEEFVSIARESGWRNGAECTLDEFLEHVSLYTDLDRLDEGDDRVSALTLHSAKGLEFSCVFIMGFEENLLPHRTAIDRGDIEEERRLCYVGMTRAKERLYLTSAASRLLYGRTNSNATSRFKEEIPEGALEVRGRMYDARAYLPDRKYSVKRRRIEWEEEAGGGDDPFASPFQDGGCGEGAEALKAGDYVRHREFGIGELISLKGGVAEVNFQDRGLKKLSLLHTALYPL